MASAVLFDLFETLMTELDDATLPYPPPWGVPGPLLGIPDETYRRAWTARKLRRMTTEFSYVEALTDVCVECGLDPPIDLIRSLNDARQSARADAFAIISPSVLDMLDRIRAADVRTVVVSNCSVEESAHFAGSPLATRVDHVMWSFSEGVQKPEPEIYLRACERAGSSASETLFVGDGSFDELRGARDAGLRPIWASWFTSGWPQHLAERRRSEVEALGIREAATPSDVVSIAVSQR